MIRIGALAAIFAPCLLLPAFAFAQAVGSTIPGRPTRIDDSGTVVLSPALTMQWEPRQGRAGSRIMSAMTQVNVRLSIAQWIGHSARIYMALPADSGPMVRASWTSGGRLLPGMLLSGGRSLVYNGPINGVTLQDILQIRLEVDERHLLQPDALVFSFEIEVNP